MRIALINENSQAAKNAAIEAALKKVVTPMGHQVDNYGMYGTEGESSADLCAERHSRRDPAQLRRGGLRRHRLRHGRGRDAGAQQLPGRALRPRGRSAPTASCSPRSTTATRYRTARLPRASAGARSCNLEYTFEKLFGFEQRQRLSRRTASCRSSATRRFSTRCAPHTLKDLITCLKGIDRELVRGAVAGERFAELFFAHAKDENIIAYVRELLG